MNLWTVCFSLAVQNALWSHICQPVRATREIMMHVCSPSVFRIFTSVLSCVRHSEWLQNYRKWVVQLFFLQVTLGDIHRCIHQVMHRVCSLARQKRRERRWGWAVCKGAKSLCSEHRWSKWEDINREQDGPKHRSLGESTGKCVALPRRTESRVMRHTAQTAQPGGHGTRRPSHINPCKLLL